MRYAGSFMLPRMLLTQRQSLVTVYVTSEYWTNTTTGAMNKRRWNSVGNVLTNWGGRDLLALSRLLTIHNAFSRRYRYAAPGKSANNGTSDSPTYIVSLLPDFDKNPDWRLSLKIPIGRIIHEISRIRP